MNWKQPKVYAVKHKDEATRAASRSGGIFTALSDLVLSNGGVVYGCVLTDDFDAVHTFDQCNRWCDQCHSFLRTVYRCYSECRSDFAE